jgi:hypothetical protein
VRLQRPYALRRSLDGGGGAGELPEEQQRRRQAQGVQRRGRRGGQGGVRAVSRSMGASPLADVNVRDEPGMEDFERAEQLAVLGLSDEETTEDAELKALRLRHSRLMKARKSTLGVIDRYSFCNLRGQPAVC